jgi:uncharacterized protein YukE
MGTPLHMNVDACNQVNAKFDQFINETKTNMNTQKSTMDGMVGTDWVAPAANQFKSDFDQLNQNMVQLLDNMNQLMQNFKNEINQWVDTGGQMG